MQNNGNFPDFGIKYLHDTTWGKMGCCFVVSSTIATAYGYLRIQVPIGLKNILFLHVIR